MKFSAVVLSALAAASSATAAAVPAPAPIAIPAELLPRGGSCPAAAPYNYCCDFIKPGLLDLNLLVRLCNLLGLNLGLDLNLAIGTQCVVSPNRQCSGSKKFKCCGHTGHDSQYGTCGY